MLHCFSNNYCHKSCCWYCSPNIEDSLRRKVRGNIVKQESFSSKCKQQRLLFYIFFFLHPSYFLKDTPPTQTRYCRRRIRSRKKFWELNNEELEEGEHEIEFDANTLSSGVYFYRLVVDDGLYMETKKLLLLK